MTYMKSVKDTFVNWFNENKTLGAILLGMIGFPLALFLVGVAIALTIMILSFLFGEFYGTAVFLTMFIGAFGGWLWSRER